MIIAGPLIFLYKFQNQFVQFLKKPFWNFNENYIEFLHKYGV